MNPFMFVELFGFRMHLFSLIPVVLTLIIIIWKLKGINFVYRLLIALNIGVFASHTGEITYTFLLSGRITFVYVISSLFILMILINLNIRLKFLKFSWIFVGILCVQIGIQIVQVLTGYYVRMNLFNQGLGLDPHNWLWGNI